MDPEKRALYFAASEAFVHMIVDRIQKKFGKISVKKEEYLKSVAKKNPAKARMYDKYWDKPISKNERF